MLWRLFESRVIARYGLTLLCVCYCSETVRGKVALGPSKKVMQGYLGDLAWETEAWCADTPDHMIHLDGEKFLGPY